MNSLTNDTRFEDISFNYTWKIQEFNKCSLDKYNNVKSGSFEFDECVYHLELYQAYMHCVTSLYATLRLERENTDSNTKKFFQFSYVEENDVLNIKGNEELKKESASTELCNWNFITDTIKDNCLTVNCKITHRHMIQRTSKEKERDTIPCQRLDKLVQDLENLLFSKEKADVFLEVDGQTIPTHSAILLARSPVFASILKINAKHRTLTVQIEGFDSVVITYLLKYIYTGKVDDLKDMSADLLAKIYAVAIRYEVPELRDICTNFMLFNLSEENIEACISLAEQNNDRNMLNLIADFVAKDPVKIINNLKWEELTKKLPHFSTMIIERCWEKMCRIKQMEV